MNDEAIKNVRQSHNGGLGSKRDKCSEGDMMQPTKRAGSGAIPTTLQHQKPPNHAVQALGGKLKGLQVWRLDVCNMTIWQTVRP